MAPATHAADIAPVAVSPTIETRGAYCNDNYFGSDGAGISACLEFAAKYGPHTIGIGLVGATPEQKGNVKSDPLDSLAKLGGWYGYDLEYAGWDAQLTGRAGIYGGAADDLAMDLRDLLHDLFGAGSKELESTTDTTFFGGISGFARRDYVLGGSDAVMTSLSPYIHGALGNDTIEAGGGLLFAIQPADETDSLALLLPKNGAYAPTFGGDGLGFFAGVRGVAHEVLYDDHTNPFIAEAGITAQATFWDFAVIGASASCTTEPYDGADKADCKATFQMGGIF